MELQNVRVVWIYNTNLLSTKESKQQIHHMVFSYILLFNNNQVIKWFSQDREKKRNADKNVVPSGLPCCICCSFPQMCCEMTRELPLIGTKQYRVDHCHRFWLVLYRWGAEFLQMNSPKTSTTHWATEHMESTDVSEQLNLSLRKRKWTEIPFNLQPQTAQIFFCR